jgi:hypothetical protein
VFVRRKKKISIWVIWVKTQRKIKEMEIDDHYSRHRHRSLIAEWKEERWRDEVARMQYICRASEIYSANNWFAFTAAYVEHIYCSDPTSYGCFRPCGLLSPSMVFWAKLAATDPTLVSSSLSMQLLPCTLTQLTILIRSLQRACNRSLPKRSFYYAWL